MAVAAQSDAALRQRLGDVAASAGAVPLWELAQQLEQLAGQMRLACNTAGAEPWQQQHNPVCGPPDC